MKTNRQRFDGGSMFGELLIANYDLNERLNANRQISLYDKRYIGKYLLDYRISVEGLTQTELVDKLYTEMAEFSFLTKYIFGTGIEEINYC